MKILKESITMDGHVLHRIQADRNIPCQDVKIGDLGGWVEKPDNLQDDAWVTGYLYEDAIACGTARVDGMVFGNAFVQRNARIDKFAKVYGNANIGGDAVITDHSVVCGNAKVSDHAVVMGYAVVSGNAIVCSGAKIHDFVHVSGHTYIAGYVSLRDKVVVEGDVTIGNHVIIKDRVIVKGHGYIVNYTRISGDLVINGEDPDFKLGFPCIIKGKGEIRKNDDIIFVSNGDESYVYIKPLNKGFGNPAVLQKVKELCIG